MSVLPFDGLGSPSYDKVLSVARLIVACVAIVVAPHCSGQESQPSESGTDTKSQSIDELLLFFPTKFPSGDWNPKDLQFTDVFFFAQDKTNLMRWRELQEERPHSHCVHVVHGDWGEVTHAMTKLYGCCFAALNMANAFVPGGAYVEGARAQEENMFRRTDCHFYVGPDEYNNTSDQYHSHMTSLLSAENGRVYLDSQHPRVCIRGPEDRSRSDLGYAWLPDAEVFPFYELRAAAQDLRNGSDFSVSNARKRIAAQLDTLIDHNVAHVVLGASGCGAFMNPAQYVAEIYRAEIEKRIQCLRVIVFAILSAGYGPDNLTPFQTVFGNYLKND